jgi:PAS domain S-box-containing protein
VQRRLPQLEADVETAQPGHNAAAFLAAIVESSDDAIVSKSLSGVITTWNKGAERLFGYAADEAIGTPITIVIPPDRLDEEPAILARIQAGERVEHFETIRRRKDGTLNRYFSHHLAYPEWQRNDRWCIEDRPRHLRTQASCRASGTSALGNGKKPVPHHRQHHHPCSKDGKDD